MGICAHPHAAQKTPTTLLVIIYTRARYRELGTKIADGLDSTNWRWPSSRLLNSECRSGRPLAQWKYGNSFNSARQLPFCRQMSHAHALWLRCVCFVKCSRTVEAIWESKKGSKSPKHDWMHLKGSSNPYQLAATRTPGLGWPFAVLKFNFIYKKGATRGRAWTMWADKGVSDTLLVQGDVHPGAHSPWPRNYTAFIGTDL